MSRKKINYKMSWSLLPPLVIALKPHDGEVVIRSEITEPYSSSNYTRTGLAEASFNEWGMFGFRYSFINFHSQEYKTTATWLKVRHLRKICNT
jgi:hypothetical protein